MIRYEFLFNVEFIRKIIRMVLFVIGRTIKRYHVSSAWRFTGNSVEMASGATLTRDRMGEW